MGFWDTFWYKKPQDSSEVSDSFGGYAPSQPSQKYPFAPIRPGRVDNANQPWYGGNTRWWGQGPDDIQYADAVAKNAVDGDSQTFYNLSDSWWNLDKWFGGSSAKQNLKDPINVSYDPQTIGSDQENRPMAQTDYGRGWYL